MTIGLGDEIFWMCPSLESNPVDLSPSARTLTLNNGTSLVNDSSEGGSKAYEFDGTDDTITTTKIWGGGLTGLSWSLWMYTNMPLTSFNAGVFFENNGNQGGFPHVVLRLGSQHSSPRRWNANLNTYDGAFNWTSIPAQTLEDSNAGWSHHAFTWEGTTAKYYLNGSEFGTGSVNANSQTTEKYNNPVTFGQAYSQYFGGKLDDFRAYDHGISESEVEHLASARGVLGEPGGGHINRTLLGVG